MFGTSSPQNKTGRESAGPMRTAGIFFLLLSLINLFNEALRDIHSLISTYSIAYVICLAIGVLLILRIKAVVPFARFAVIMGVAAGGGYLLVHGLYLDFVLQLILCSGLWLLLSPRSREYRILYSSGVVTVSLMLGINLLLMNEHYQSSGKWLDFGNNHLSSTLPDTVFGNNYTYRLDFARAVWHKRPHASYAKSNPATDLWLVDPSKDAHLMVIAEHTPDGSNADLKAFSAAVRYNLLKRNPNARLLKVKSLTGIYYDGILLKLSSSVDGVPLEYLVGLYTVKSYAFQVIGFTHKNEFSSVKPELIDGIKSFYFDTEAQQKRDDLHVKSPLVNRMR